MGKAYETNKILGFGMAGIIGVFLTIVSDLILLARPNSAFSFLMLGTESMADISHWRITIGAFMGVFFLPFQISGLISMYYGLKPSGKILSFVILATNAHAIIMGVAFHISYAFIGSGWKLYYEIGLNNSIIADIMRRYDFYWKVIVFIMVGELLFSSLIYVALIIKGKSLYPKWMAVLNPIILLLILFPVIFALPAPVGGIIAPAYFNLSTLAFMILSTTVIYRRIRLSTQ